MFVEIPKNNNSISKRKPINGIGINDAEYKTAIVLDGKRITCPYYDRWIDMIRRCYCDLYQKEYPTYIGCTVCDEWKLFSVFREWMSCQDWIGKYLDKDIITPKNKIYSPDNCCFISGKLNVLLRNKTRGEYPMGVAFKKNRYISRCVDLNGKRKQTGCFKTIEEAKQSYIDFKSKIIIAEANKQTDVRIRDGLLKHADILLNS